MSEMKRVELTTVQPSQNEKKVKKKANTYRFHLTLGESNQTRFPEYSFADLIKNDRQPASVSGDDPFGEANEDGEVAAIARKFEEKYGPKGLQVSKKRRTPDFEDYYDLGDGYDENDPFIDNTEAYDEVIPTSKRTKYGGFYINQGTLDVQVVNEDSLEEFVEVPIVKKKKKKRVLDSDNEEENGEDLKKKFKAMKRKKFLESKENEKKKKKKKTANGEEKDVPVKKKKKKLDKLIQKKVSPAASSPSQRENAGSLVSTNNPGTTVTNSNLATTSTKTAVSTNGVLEEEAKGKDRIDSIEETFNAILQETMKDDSSSKSGEEGKGEQQSGDKNTQLPPQLPLELLENIENIKKEAKENKEGKSKFFSADINKLLLAIELGSRKLVWGSRTAIYNHLGEHLPCGKHALQRRAKKLRESQQDDQLKGPIQKLGDAIMKVMPGQQEQHELEVQKVKLEAEMKDEMSESVKEEASTESEGEEKSDNRKKPRGPRRKFQWDKEMKDLLLKIVSTKMKLYNTCKSRNQTPEEYLKAFLDSEIRPLWPQGWMQTRMLFKESRSAHEDKTKGITQQPKQKKAATGSESLQTVQDSSRPHVSKTEDVIEVSSVLEDESERKETVVVNLSNADGKPMPSLLPATAASHPSYTSVPSASSSTVNRLNKQSGRQIVTVNPSVSVLPPPSASQLAQKTSDVSTSPTVKRVTPIPVIETPETPPGPSQRQIASPLSAINATFTPLSQSASLVSPSHNSSSRSYSEAFDSFINQSLAKGDSTPTSSSLHQQHKQSSSMQQLGSLQQQKLLSSQPQQKVSVLPQKSGPHQPASGLYQQHKLPQDQSPRQSGVQQQKAAAVRSPSTVVTDIPNSSWTNVSSIVPVGKSTSPVVAVNRIPMNTLHKRSTGSKIPHSSLQQKQSLMQQARSESLAASKPSQNYVPKKRQQAMGTDIPGTVSNPSHTSDKLGTAMGIHMSSKDPQNKVMYQQQPLPSKGANSSNSQLKFGTVLGTSDPRHPQYQQQVKGGIFSGTNTSSLSALNVRTAADFAGYSSQKNKRQPSPPKKFLPSNTSGDRTSPTASSSKTTGLLNSSFPPSLSRDSTPSPQKSPMSPGGNAALSLYEQIRSQIQNQEAMEGQALKNLAFALQFGGAASGGTSFPGKKSAMEALTGKTCHLPSNSNVCAQEDDIKIVEHRSSKPPSNIPQDLSGLNLKEMQTANYERQLKKSFPQAFRKTMDSELKQVKTSSNTSGKGHNHLNISGNDRLSSKMNYIPQKPSTVELKKLTSETVPVDESKYEKHAFTEKLPFRNLEDRTVRSPAKLTVDRRKKFSLLKKTDSETYGQRSTEPSTSTKHFNRSAMTSRGISTHDKRAFLPARDTFSALARGNIFDKMNQTMPGSKSFIPHAQRSKDVESWSSKDVTSSQTGKIINFADDPGCLSRPQMPFEEKMSLSASQQGLPYSADSIQNTVSEILGSTFSTPQIPRQTIYQQLIEQGFSAGREKEDAQLQRRAVEDFVDCRNLGGHGEDTNNQSGGH